MLLIVSKSLRGTKAVSDAARELSLTLRHFDSPEALSALMAGKSRRIVMLDKDDVTRAMITRLDARRGRVPFALVIAADRVANVRLANPARPMQGLVVWLDDGTVVVVAAIDDRDGDSVELALPTGQTGVFPVDSLNAVAFHAGRLQGLASLIVPFAAAGASRGTLGATTRRQERIGHSSRLARGKK